MAARTIERRIEPRLLPPVLDDRPFYDEELDLAHSPAHRRMIFQIGSILEGLGDELGYPNGFDNPIWFLEPSSGEQKVLYPDIVLMEPGTDSRRATAEDALLVAEVVSTTDRRKEHKDTVTQRGRCEHNRIPEFYLFFPEIDDDRALTSLRLGAQGSYEEHTVEPEAVVASQTVPGLAFRVLPKDAWSPGRKIDVLFKGKVLLPVAEERARADDERARADDERARADDERARADDERARADKERARAEQAIAQLRALGVELPEE